MSLENKKFLDQAGTTHLWTKIKEQLDTKGQVDSVTAGDNSITVGGTASAPTIALKLSAVTGNSLEVKSDGVYVNAPAGVTYSIVKKQTANTGYAASYSLTANGTATGTDIDIPKDMVVSAGEVKTVSAADKATNGKFEEDNRFSVGDSYIELTLANATEDKIYIPANSLIEYVTSGSQSGDMIVVSIDSSHQVTATITDGTVTKAKLHSGVQASLGLADTAIQGIAEGANNGEIKYTVDGTNYTAVSVHGLGSAAYTNSTAYDAAGEADAVYAAIIALSNNEIDAAIAAATSSSGSGS